MLRWFQALQSPIKSNDCNASKIIIIIIIIIIMYLQPFVGAWPLFQFLDPIHSR
jgi:hypothetical protein